MADGIAALWVPFQGRLSQWNTCEIYATSTLEEALTRVEEPPTIF